MSNCSMIDGHIDNMTNYERIQAMSVDEMAEMIADEIPHGDCYGCELDCYIYDSCKDAWKQWLEGEVKK